MISCSPFFSMQTCSMQNLFVRYRICLSYAERFSVSGSQRSFSISRTSD